MASQNPSLDPYQQQDTPHSGSQQPPLSSNSSTTPYVPSQTPNLDPYQQQNTPFSEPQQPPPFGNPSGNTYQPQAGAPPTTYQHQSGVPSQGPTESFANSGVNTQYHTTGSHQSTTGAHHAGTATQQTPAKVSVWDKARHGGKATFDKAWAGFERLGLPVNKLTNKIGSEAFWPTSLNHESDKAARILKSFCKDGFYTDQPSAPTTLGPKGKPKVLVKIPQRVIQNCVGLAIFTVMRTGLWVSGAGGSGVLIARKEDGSWSPPSGILVHTLGVGFMAGIDIYDCVIVINNREALKAFSKLRVSLGGELSVVAGPLGAGGAVESELLKNRKPMLSYMKSRGLYGGIQLDGTVIVERNDENARFYGERLPVGAILAGQLKTVPQGTRMLMEVAKQAEGRKDVDEAILQQVAHQPPPSDLDVEKMSEPTQEQKNNYAPPPNFDTAHSGPTGSYGATPIYGTDQKHPSGPGYEGTPNYGTIPAYGDETAYGAVPSGQAFQSTPGIAPHETGSEFAAPPTQPVRRTDSGFAPPPGAPHAQVQGKQDPDGPPRYA